MNVKLFRVEKRTGIDNINNDQKVGNLHDNELINDLLMPMRFLPPQLLSTLSRGVHLFKLAILLNLLSSFLNFFSEQFYGIFTI